MFYKQSSTFSGILGLSFLLLSGCGKHWEALQENVETREKSETSQLVVSVQAPPSILYTQKELPGFYTSTGNGSIGEFESFQMKDTLSPYTGIPVFFEGLNKNQEKFTEISSTGDSLCHNLFYYDPASSEIKIKQSDINSLVLCKVEVKVSPQGDSNKISSKAHFDIAFSPTLKMYYENQDPLALKLFKTYMSSDSTFNDFSKWLSGQSKINLHWEEQDGILQNINALVAMPHIKFLDLSHSQIQNIRALRFLKELEELDLSQTRVVGEGFYVLASLSNLRKLTIQNAGIQQIDYITENAKNLISLDLSYNKKIADLDTLNNIKNIQILTLKDTGLNKSSIKTLSEIKQLKNLDISSNNLSNVTANEARALASLPHLEKINISESKISYDALNAYLFYAAEKNILKTFIDRNNFSRKKGHCQNIHSFSDAKTFSNLHLMSNLEELDVSGNSCLGDDGSYYGVRNLNFIKDMKKLAKLNISHNAIDKLGPLKNFSMTLNPAYLFLEDVGSSALLTKEACEDPLNPDQLGGSIYAQNCSQLTAHSTWHSQEYKSPGDFVFQVPDNVTALFISGCSAGNGGQGGQAGQNGFSHIFYGGGNAAPSQSIAREDEKRGWQMNWGQDMICTTDPLNNHCEGFGYFYGPSLPALGRWASAQDSQISRVEGLFEADQEPHMHTEGVCAGGHGGAGGHAGENTTHENPSPRFAYNPRSGSTGESGAGKALKSRTLSISPGLLLKVHVGQGGPGGEGSGPMDEETTCLHSVAESMRHVERRCGSVAEAGKRGQNGAPGYIRIQWQE